MTAPSHKLLIISAPSGAGKTTLVQEVMHQFDIFEFSISATTRNPRKHEKAGEHYYFLSVQEFKERIEQGDFVEWEEVYEGRFYGSLRSEVDRILAKGKCPIFDVDVEGGLNIKQQFGERAVAIFISPPSIQELENRLMKRATDSTDEIKKRLAKSQNEMSYAQKFDHIIVNDLLDQAIAELASLIKHKFFGVS